jgi:hypothetical protein
VFGENCGFASVGSAMQRPVSDVPNVQPLRSVPVVQPEYRSQFQLFQTSNRFAQFKSFKQAKHGLLKFRNSGKVDAGR